MAGYPKVVLNVEDRSITQPSQPIGVAAIAIQTQRGQIGVSKYLRSWQEYRENYGELVDTSDTLGPVYAKRVFDNGGQLFVTRIVHYSDINDIDSATPTNATGANGGVFAFSEQIVSVDLIGFTITVLGDITPYVSAGDSHIVQLAGGGTSAITVAPAGAAYAGGFTTITYVALGGTEASGDALTFSVTLTASLNYEASSRGAWGNNIEVEIRLAASGLANAVDIFARSNDPTIFGSDLNEVYRNFPTTPTAGDINKFNLSMGLLQIPTTGGVISTPIGVVPPNVLTGGTDDYASVDDVDYIGSISANTGIRAFDGEQGFVRIACPEVSVNVIDNALLAYVEERLDCLAIIRTPESITGAAAVDYRNAAGVYSAGTKIDNWRAIMLYGGLKVVSPFSGDEGAEITISWIGDYLGLSAVKDNLYGAWVSVSGFPNNRGVITNYNEIVYNINTPNRAQEREDVVAAGLFPIAVETLSGIKNVVSWGSRTLQVAPSLLQQANVADLLIFLNNSITPVAKGQLFNPNDVLTWKTIYRGVKNIMDRLIDRGAIEAYRYEGDQNVDNRSQAVVNTPTTIAQGIYKFNLFFIPIGVIEEVQGTLIVTPSGVLLESATAI